MIISVIIIIWNIYYIEYEIRFIYNNENDFITFILKYSWRLGILIVINFHLIFNHLLQISIEITKINIKLYSDWWNALGFLEFNRKWNIPVHRFLKE